MAGQDRGDCPDEMKLKLETGEREREREKREAEGAVSDVGMDVDLIPNIKVKAQELRIQ